MQIKLAYPFAVKSVHKSALGLNKTERFYNSLHYKKIDKVVTSNIDKVKIAHKVVESDADFSILDLKIQINKIVEFIKSFNDEFIGLVNSTNPIKFNLYEKWKL